MAYQSKYTGKEVEKAIGLAMTALQEHQDISGLATKDEVKEKQDLIQDLDSIREGANRYIPTKVSDLENDTDFISSDELDKKLEEFTPSKDDIMAIELSEQGEMVLTYGDETSLSDGYISEDGDLVLEFNYE